MAFVILLAQSGVYDPERPSLVAFVFDGFEPGMNRLISEGDAREKIVKRFGKPASRDLRQEPDDKEPGLRDVMTWHYDGLEIATYGWHQTPNQWIRKITLTNPAYKLKFGLCIGSKREEFIEKLGPPNPFATAPGIPKIVYMSSYYGSEGGVDVGSLVHVDVYFDQQDRAQKIVWEYFAD